MIAERLERGARVVVCDEPTRGIDVGACYDIYEWIRRMASEGKAVLLISAYVLDTFPTIRDREEARYGEYRSKRIILEAYASMARATKTSSEYQAVVDPAPVDLPVHGES